MSDNITNPNLGEQELRRREELQLLEEAGINPYPYAFNKTHQNAEILAQFNDDTPETLANVGVTGRIVSIRRMGKASFVHILDGTAKLQVYDETFNNFNFPTNSCH